MYMYITAWQQSTTLDNRALISLVDYLLANYGDMPKDHQSRGGNAFMVSKGKGKKGKGSGRGKGKYFHILIPAKANVRRLVKAILKPSSYGVPL